jgi:UDP-galactopyranose mutase
MFKSCDPSTSETPVDEKFLREEERDSIICFSHLRWNFVFQRPQQIMTRLARSYDVLFWEEPVEDEKGPARIEEYRDGSGVTVIVPHLPKGLGRDEQTAHLRALLNRRLAGIEGHLVRWYYTPMMLPFSRHLNSAYCVYDCMDELSAFDFAPAELPWLERELFGIADVVFTGGYSLYEAKQAHHGNVHPFPSSVDQHHFGKARELVPANNARPRIGFYGVIDERFDIALLRQLAAFRPEIDFEIVGPVVKIDPAALPRADNILYTGPQPYADLPACLGRWHAAMMPFALNESTRFISPTKTPEYLAAGRPVISTAIRDVERHYGEVAGVMIADDADGFAAACDCAVLMFQDNAAWLAQVDQLLSQLSWDKTVWEMNYHLCIGLTRRRSLQTVRSRKGQHYDYLIVGAGFAGAVMAERLAADANKRVLVIDRRHHIGGNAYDERNAAGTLVHRYGPHIFHTNSEEIFAYLSRFTAWRNYSHRVLAQVGEKLVPIPINRTTLNLLYGLNITNESEAAAFLASRAESVEIIKTSEDVVVAAIGRELYELFFRGYTRKQWGLDPSELNKSVTARIPTRTNEDDRYFTDKFQAMPAEGYTRMFERMLDHPNIDVALGVSVDDVAANICYSNMVWTGAIDEHFGHCFGALPYRSLRFDHQTLRRSQFQPVGTVNYPSEDVPYTRITEFSHLTGETGESTSIVYEYPSATGDPYYPIPRPENHALYERYARLADASDVIFVGRLATYRYYNMDQIVGQALATYRRHSETLKVAGIAPLRVGSLAAQPA